MALFALKNQWRKHATSTYGDTNMIDLPLCQEPKALTQTRKDNLGQRSLWSLSCFNGWKGYLAWKKACQNRMWLMEHSLNTTSSFEPEYATKAWSHRSAEHHRTCYPWTDSCMFQQKKGQHAKWRWLCQYQLAPYGIAYSSRWDVTILIIVWSYLIFACQRRTPPTFNSLKKYDPFFRKKRTQKHIVRGWAPSYWNRQLPFNWAKGCFSCGATMASRALMSASMPVAGRLVDFSFKKSYLWLTPYASFPMGTLLFKPSVICKVYESTNMPKAHATV